MSEGIFNRLREEPVLLVDTLPAWMHCAGYFARHVLVAEHGRRAAQAHFEFSDAILRSGKQILITPYVLGELFERAKRVKPASLPRFVHHYRGFLLQWQEELVRKDRLLTSAHLDYGVTDVSILEVARRTKVPVLSGDRVPLELCRSEGVEIFDYWLLFANREFLLGGRRTGS